MTDNKKGPEQLVQKIATTILATLTFITAIINFVKLWQGDRGITTVVISIVGFVILIIVFLYYSYRLNKFIIDDLKNLDRIIILVADFDGPEHEKYRVTEIILSQLRELAREFKDIEIRALNERITEKQGRRAARLKGKTNNASIVIWGWYSATTPALVKTYFEIIRDFANSGKEIKEKENSFLPITKLAQIESLELQTKLSKEMNYLVLFVAGLARFMVGDWDRAISRFTRALTEVRESVSTPNQSFIYTLCGEAYSNINDHKNAIACYSHVLEIEPDLTDLYFELGNEYAAIKSFDKAIASLDKFIKSRQDFAPAYYNRGNYRSEIQDYDKALDDYNKAIALENQSELKAAYITNRGNIHWSTGNTKDALKDYDQAIALWPDHIPAYINRGGLYLTQENYDRAIKDYNHCIKLQPNNAQAFLNRGRAYADHGFGLIDQHAIKDEFGVILKDDRGRPIGYLSNPGDKYSWHDELRDFSKALKDFARAIELRPDWVDIYWFRSRIQIELGKFNDALKDMNQILQLDPENANAYLRRADIHVRLHNFKRAIVDYSRAIQIQPTPADAYFNRGYLYKKIGDYEKATNDLNKFIELTDDLIWKKRAQELLSNLAALE